MIFPTKFFHHRWMYWAIILVSLVSLTLSSKPHILEFVHYYLGAKYHAELGYTGLYDALSAALAQINGRQDFLRRISAVRDISTGEYTTPVSALLRFERKSSKWIPKRWSEFVNDVRFLNNQLLVYSSKPPIVHWQKILIDHGYNAPPTYTAYVSPIVNAVQLNFITLHILCTFDMVLIFIIFVLVLKVFGFRGAVISFLFFASSFDMLSYVTWALFRFDWIFCIALSLYFLNKRRYIPAGVMWGISSSLRIFPAIIAGAFILLWIFSSDRNKSSRRDIVRFASFAIFGAATFSALSTVALHTMQGLSPIGVWKSFFGRIGFHAGSENILNIIGLGKIFETLGLSAFSAVAAIVSIILAVALLWALSEKSQKPHKIAALSILFAPMLIYASHYYYLMLLFVVALLDRRLTYLSVWLIATNILVEIADKLGSNYFTLLHWECMSYSLALISVPITLTGRKLYQIRDKLRKS